MEYDMFRDRGSFKKTLKGCNVCVKPIWELGSKTRTMPTETQTMPFRHNVYRNKETQTKRAQDKNLTAHDEEVSLTTKQDVETQTCGAQEDQLRS